MRYIIYGAGAVGGVIGARLFEHDRDVVLIARGAHLEAIRERGLTIETPSFSREARIPAVAHPSELQFSPDDVVFMTVKTQHTEAALNDLHAAAGGDIPIVCAQNGVENERLALRRFSRVYAMLVILPATYLVPGMVQAHAAPTSGILDAGCYPAGTDLLIARVAADLDESGFSAHAAGDVMRWKYAKLLSNLGNALQAACEPDEVAARLHARMIEEALACYRAAGIDWASDAEMDDRRSAMSRLGTIAGSVRGGGSSWQSLARASGSIESDYLNGEIALLGRLHGIPTPVNVVLQQMGERMSRERMPPASLTAAEIERQVGTQT